MRLRMGDINSDLWGSRGLRLSRFARLSRSAEWCVLRRIHSSTTAMLTIGYIYGFAAGRGGLFGGLGAAPPVKKPGCEEIMSVVVGRGAVER